MRRVIVKNSDYGYNTLRADVFDILSMLDTGIINQGSKVFIKPNFLTAATVEQAVTTHPLVIKAVAEYALSKGAKVQVSDSPPTGQFEKIIRVCGVKDALRELPVVVKELSGARLLGRKGKFDLELAEDALDADVIINLPKLKSHGQMGLTLAVKNLFGCVLGMKKPEWHFRVGENKRLFAELLVTIYSTLKPRINLLDGILSMEGQGPGAAGTPRHIGVLIGSGDALSLDMAVCRMLNREPMSLLTNKAAKEMGLVGEYTVEGTMPLIKDFSIPSDVDLLFGPRAFHRHIRRHFTSRPEGLKEICRFCNECVNICPAGAIKRGKKKIEFNYEKCIRCYCCLEICPHRAIAKKTPLLRRLLGRLVKS